MPLPACRSKRLPPCAAHGAPLAPTPQAAASAARSRAEAGLSIACAALLRCLCRMLPLHLRAAPNQAPKDQTGARPTRLAATQTHSRHAATGEQVQQVQAGRRAHLEALHKRAVAHGVGLEPGGCLDVSAQGVLGHSAAAAAALAAAGGRGAGPGRVWKCPRAGSGRAAAL